MKKLYTVMLSLAMLFSLAACGSTQGTATGDNSNPTMSKTPQGIGGGAAVDPAQGDAPALPEYSIFEWVKDEFDTFSSNSYSEGLHFKLNSDNETYSCVGIGDCTDKYVVIPATYEELPVTKVELGRSETWMNGVMEGIIIPDGVQEIAHGVFSGCNTLKRITIPNSVTSIGANAFCNSGLTRIDIPGSVSVINTETCSNCIDLKYATFGEGLTQIDMTAFNECVNLLRVDFPNSLISIDYRAFYGCASLPYVKLGGALQTIGFGAFSNCSELTYVEVPDGLLTIDSDAFSYCPKLSSINIPDSVTVVGGGAFSDCTNLKSIVIPNGVTTINNITFSNCTNLSSVQFGPNIVSIGAGAFSLCENLKSVDLPASLNNIDSGAFSGSGITEIYIPDNVDYIDPSAFYHSINLTSISVSENNSSYTSKNGVLYTKDMSMIHTFPAGSKDTTVSILDGVTVIGDYCFSGYTVEKLIIPKSIISISSNYMSASSLTTIMVDEANPVFSSLDGVLFNKDHSVILDYPGGREVTEYTIPTGVKAIATAFNGCSNLKAVNIPNTVTEIRDNAFCACLGLESIVIPESVKSIDFSAFTSCESLSSITFYGMNVEIADFCFYECNNLTFYCHAGSSAQYYAEQNGIAYTLI